MTPIDPGFAYAQPRLQARYGARPSAADWSHFAATADLRALLQVLRSSRHAGWVDRIGPRPRLHEVDRRLREKWLDCVDEVAGWQPDRWRAAIRWLRWIVYLPSLHKLARGGRPPAWMRDDAVLGAVVARDPRDRAKALERSPLAPLAAGFAAPADVAGAWVRQWRRLWPRGEAARAPIEALVRLVASQPARLDALPGSARSSDKLRELERRLELAFRHHPLSPAATVAYLGLLALDLRRLRGVLATRALLDAEATP